MPSPRLEQGALGVQHLVPCPGRAFWQRQPESLEGQVGLKEGEGGGLEEQQMLKKQAGARSEKDMCNLWTKLKMVVTLARALYPTSATL